MADSDGPPLVLKKESPSSSHDFEGLAGATPCRFKSCLAQLPKTPFRRAFFIGRPAARSSALTYANDYPESASHSQEKAFERVILKHEPHLLVG